MSHPADSPESQDALRIERQLALLGELAEIGLDVARAVERQARADAPPPAAETALAYARVSRAVRQTVMLQSKLMRERREQALDAQDEADAAEVQDLEDRKARVQRIVERVAKARHVEDAERVEALVYEAAERLDDEDLYGDLMAQSLPALVTRLCRDLGLDPDWEALAQELWAKDAAEDDPLLPRGEKAGMRVEALRQRRSSDGVASGVFPSPARPHPHPTLSP